MRTITPARVEKRSTNCSGRDEHFTVQEFEIGQEDVGTVCMHYLGYRHREYKFLGTDVGRTIQRVRQPSGYSMWAFYTEGKLHNEQTQDK